MPKAPQGASGLSPLISPACRKRKKRLFLFSRCKEHYVHLPKRQEEYPDTPKAAKKTYITSEPPPSVRELILQRLQEQLECLEEVTETIKQSQAIGKEGQTSPGLGLGDLQITAEQLDSIMHPDGRAGSYRLSSPPVRPTPLEPKGRILVGAEVSHSMRVEAAPKEVWPSERWSNLEREIFDLTRFTIKKGAGDEPEPRMPIGQSLQGYLYSLVAKVLGPADGSGRLPLRAGEDDEWLEQAEAATVVNFVKFGEIGPGNKSSV